MDLRPLATNATGTVGAISHEFASGDGANVDTRGPPFATLRAVRLPIRVAGEDLDRIIASLDNIAGKLDKLIAVSERAVTTASVYAARRNRPSQSSPRRPNSRSAPRIIKGRRSVARPTSRGETPPKRLRLHEAIEIVLREAGIPLSAREIAEQLNERNLFVGRTSGRPVSGNQVNSRVSHPHYKRRFNRANRRIGLSEE